MEIRAAAVTFNAFDPADADPPAQESQQLLGAAQEWNASAGFRLVVAPHPDDEILGGGGLVQSWAEAGNSVTILSVTDVEAADGTRNGLDVLRRKGLVRYTVWTWQHARALSVRSLSWIRFSVTDAGRRSKARALQRFASQLRPAVGPPIVPAHILEHFHRRYEGFVS